MRTQAYQNDRAHPNLALPALNTLAQPLPLVRLKLIRIQEG